MSASDWALIGSISLGIVVAFLAWWFVTRQTDFSAANLAAFVAVLVAGTAVEFLADEMGAKRANYGQYAFGLLIGTVAYVVLNWIKHGFPPMVFGARLFGGGPRD